LGGAAGSGSGKGIVTDERFKDVVFLVEATDFEVLALWESKRGSLRWEWERRGFSVHIGNIEKRPICVAFQFARIEDQRIAFYEGCSELVDHEMIDNWLRKHCYFKWDGGTRRAHCNAMNFHLCIQAIRELNGLAGKPA
jgi:hypothetical protein